MRLSALQKALLCWHALKALVVSAIIGESVTWSERTDPYSLKRILAVACYASLTLAPFLTLLVWIRIADANDRKTVYITEFGATYEVTISQDDVPVTYTNIPKPILPWKVLIGVVAIYPIAMLGTTAYVLAMRRTSVLDVAFAERIALYCLLTLVYGSWLVLSGYGFKSFYEWCYADHTRQVESARRTALVTRKGRVVETEAADREQGAEV